MSELPTSALDHPATPITNLAELAASATCASYRLGPATALDVTEHVLGHLGSYFAVPEAHRAPASQRELPLVHRVSFLDQLEPHARSTLLYRIAADFDPTGLRDTVRSALAQDERLYGAVDRAIRHALRRYAGVHTFHHNDPRRTANFHDVVEEVMVQLRRSLNPIISDAIIAQTFASDHRRQQPT